MIFEFLIAYHRTFDTKIVAVVREYLAKALGDNLNEFDTETVARMVIPRAERLGNAPPNDNSEFPTRALLCFALDLPEETESLRIVVDEFADALDTSPVVHLVKFDDPLLRADLAHWANEIYALEMKLRRVLTFILSTFLRGWRLLRTIA